MIYIRLNTRESITVHVVVFQPIVHVHVVCRRRRRVDVSRFVESWSSFTTLTLTLRALVVLLIRASLIPWQLPYTRILLFLVDRKLHVSSCALLTNYAAQYKNMMCEGCGLICQKIARNSGNTQTVSQHFAVPNATVQYQTSHIKRSGMLQRYATTPPRRWHKSPYVYTIGPDDVTHRSCEKGQG